MRIGRAWKMFELEVAKAYGGMRRVRINYGERGSDIIHDKYSIECKYGWQIPDKALEGKRCKFLDKAFQQAHAYNPTLIPVICLKRPRMAGFVSIEYYAEENQRVIKHPAYRP
jgi:hypothetical protein